MRQDDRFDSKSLSILKAASEVFLEHGFNAATTDMIQRAAGVSKATLYARYPNKEALFCAVIEHQCGKFTRQVETLAVTPGDIRKVLQEIGRTLPQHTAVAGIPGSVPGGGGRGGKISPPGPLLLYQRPRHHDQGIGQTSGKSRHCRRD